MAASALTLAGEKGAIDQPLLIVWRAGELVTKLQVPGKQLAPRRLKGAASLVIGGTPVSTRQLPMNFIRADPMTKFALV